MALICFFFMVQRGCHKRQKKELLKANDHHVWTFIDYLYTLRIALKIKIWYGFVDMFKELNEHI